MSRLKRGGTLAAACVAMVACFEGLRLTTYRDAVGIPTVCYGETLNVRMGQKHTKSECDAMLLKRLDVFANGVERCVTQPMSYKTEAAFVSLAYNIGTGGFCSSSVVRRFNAGQSREACDAMLMWNKAGGRVLPGLTRRRQEERASCLEGIAE